MREPTRLSTGRRRGSGLAWCKSRGLHRGNDVVQFLSQMWETANMQGYAGRGWYFWDESSFNCYGPYDNREEAEKKSSLYYHEL